MGDQRSLSRRHKLIDNNSGGRRDSAPESAVGRGGSSALGNENSDASVIIAVILARKAKVEKKETARKIISNIYKSHFI